MIAAVSMRFDQSKPSPPAWEGPVSDERSAAYEAYLVSVEELYPEVVSLQVDGLTFEDLVRWASESLFDPDLTGTEIARSLVRFLLGVRNGG
jgi:hypothetical protein